MMGWLWVWLRDRQERRAEAAVREHERQMAAYDPEPMTSLRPPQMASPVDYGHEQRLDAIRREVVTLEHIMDLIEECRRADALAGEHGGFVETARIRDILRGRP